MRPIYALMVVMGAGIGGGSLLAVAIISIVRMWL